MLKLSIELLIIIITLHTFSMLAWVGQIFSSTASCQLLQFIAFVRFTNLRSVFTMSSQILLSQRFLLLELHNCHPENNHVSILAHYPFLHTTVNWSYIQVLYQLIRALLFMHTNITKPAEHACLIFFISTYAHPLHSCNIALHTLASCNLFFIHWEFSGDPFRHLKEWISWVPLLLSTIQHLQDVKFSHSLLVIFLYHCVYIMYSKWNTYLLLFSILSHFL